MGSKKRQREKEIRSDKIIKNEENLERDIKMRSVDRVRVSEIEKGRKGEIRRKEDERKIEIRRDKE